MAFARPTITCAEQVERVRQISVLMPFAESDLEGRARVALNQRMAVERPRLIQRMQEAIADDSSLAALSPKADMCSANNDICHGP
jgi:hypothetical protein